MKTAIVPTVSCANVPQLACDLLVHTLDLRLLERLEHDSLYPFASAREDPGGQPGVCTALELLANTERSLIVVAQRAPPLPGREDAFVGTLLDALKKHGVSDVILLTSADANYRTDAQINAGPLIKLDLEHALSQLSLDAARDDAPYAGARDDDDDDAPYSGARYDDDDPASGKLRGTGELRQLLLATRKLGDVDCSCLFAHQGDNRADAAFMARHVLSTLAQRPEKHEGVEIDPQIDLVEPPSWQGLFGPPLDRDNGMFY